MFLYYRAKAAKFHITDLNIYVHFKASILWDIIRYGYINILIILCSNAVFTIFDICFHDASIYRKSNRRKNRRFIYRSEGYILHYIRNRK